jgi:hypothetical protein
VTQSMRPSNATIAAAKAMYERGVAKADIARRVGFSDSTVGRWIRGPQPQPPPQDVEQPRRWVEAAICAQVDPEIFHPEKGRHTNRAINICRVCPVQEPCLQWALEHHETGIWGGTTERRRQELRRRKTG